MKQYVLLFLALLLAQLSHAQMWNGTDTLYGNEWIEKGKSYFKVPVAEDGLYRIGFQTLKDAGIPVASLQGSQFQLFRLGQQVPLYVSTNNFFDVSDYLEFFGQKNRGEFDRHLYANPDDDQLNPRYSLFTDTTMYFLTWSPAGTANRRYQTIANDLTNLPPREPFFVEQQTQDFFSTHSKRFLFPRNSDLFESNFNGGEGFFSGFNGTINLTFNPKGLVSTGGDSKLFVRYLSKEESNPTTITLNGNALGQGTLGWYELRNDSFVVQSSLLTTNTAVRITGNNGVVYATLSYPRGFDFDNASSTLFHIGPAADRKYLEIKNFNAGVAPPVLYDLNNQMRLEATVEAGTVRITLPVSPVNRQLILANTASGIRKVTKINAVSFDDFNDLKNADFIILSHRALFNDGKGRNLVQEYAAYRATPQGGRHNVAVVEIQQLYDQFGYGVQRSQQAIRNFGFYVRKNWRNAQYLFMIGEGREYNSVRTGDQLALDINQTFHIPTFGYPGSDNLLLSTNSTSMPVLAIGRLAVSGTDDLAVYFDKVKTLEANAGNPQTIRDKAWMKRILHLGGGAQAAEQQQLRNNLNELKAIIENNKFGANVSSFFKTSTDPIQISQNEQIFSIINGGVSMITFFGHAAVGTFDFNIDNPESYQNYGKYPFVVSLGCYSGNIHNSIRGVGKRFCFQKDAGAILFGATTGLGYPNALQRLATEMYSYMGGGGYGQGTGDIIRQSISTLDRITSFDIRTLCQQFTLLGDPAIRLNPAPGPDYVVDASSVSFEPQVVNAQTANFDLSFKIANIGFAVQDSIQILVTREYPGGVRETVVKKTISTPSFDQSLSFKIPTGGKAAVGLNRFYIKCDATDRVREFPLPEAENNNDLIGSNGQQGATLFITDNTAQAIYPPQFSIVNRQNIELKASTTNSLAPARKYLFEIDTTQLYNSPFKKRTAITQSGGLLKWKPPVTFQDSTVYYWRVSPDSTSQLGYVWDQSSFVYLANSPNGWNQSHFFQYHDNEFGYLRLDSLSRRFSFVNNFLEFTVKNRARVVDQGPNAYVNNSFWSEFFENYLPQYVSVVVFDSLGKFWLNPPPGKYGSINNVFSSPISCFPFPVETADQRKNIIDFLENTVPPGATVVFYNLMENAGSTLNVADWESDSLTNNGKNIFNILERQGARKIRSMKTGGAVPYVFVYEKNTKALNEVIAPTALDRAEVTVSVKGFWDDGSFKSVVIGPAKSWSRFQHLVDSSRSNALDRYYVRVIGLDTLGGSRVFADRLTARDTQLNFIDAGMYPQLRLEYYASDAQDKSPVQLSYWRVLYEGLPDAAVNPAAFFVAKDSVQQGDFLQLRFAVENPTDYDLDSLDVKYILRDVKNKEIDLYDKLRPLAKGDTLIATLQVDSRNLADAQQVTVELNPFRKQPELYYFNNFLFKSMQVGRDKINPLLDVTFDGKHILNGDVIATKPRIIITLKDENKFLPLNDTGHFKIFVRYPNAFDVTRIPFDNASMRFTPADPANVGKNNRAVIEWSPIFKQDGTYQLLVQAEDASGNQSGRLDYKVSFEVITKPSISNFLNYPNPFTTQTRFVYTLTGDEVPAFFTIQIMTVSGQIVRELTQQDLGPLRIGTNLTDNAWDGTDQYGQRLANGVYLYRVITKNASGQSYETLGNASDRFFRNGIGKLVILR